MPRALLATLFFFVLLAVVTVVRYDGSPPRGKDAPASEFSADRAREALRQLLGDEAPHPVGSEENARVRARIVAELTRNGYAPEVQSAFACGKHGSCGYVQNVVARLSGRERGTVLVAAHYDSVGASPGANDDGSGVAAILEIARALRASPLSRHPIVLLLDEGEEAGLLGAEAFARDHRWMADVRAVVNLDARGSSGPSMMFETSPENAWIIDLMAASLPRPVTSSLYYAIYKRMPNDTDLTVFKRTAHGVNFAFTGSLEHYHTPLDRLENTRTRTLQQQGENGLAMVRAFANADIANPPPGDAVWFDVVGAFVVRWPQRWTAAIALAALGLVVLGIGRRARDGALELRGLMVGTLAIPASLLAGAIAAAIIGFVLHATGALPAPMVANATAIQAAIFAGSAAVSAAVGAFGSRYADGPALAFGAWLTWALLGLGTVFILPGASFLFVVPALAAGLGGLARGSRMGPAVIGAITAACLWIPVLHLLYQGIGLAVPAVHGLVVAVLLGTLVPFAATLSPSARTRFPALAAVVTVILTVIACLRAPFTAEQPQRTNLVFHQDEAGKARWLVDATWGGGNWGKPPAAMRRALGPGAHDAPRFPWSAETVAVTDAPRIDAEPPTLTVEFPTSATSGPRTAYAHLASPRGARTLLVILPPGAQAKITRANGVLPIGPRALSQDGWRSFTFLAVPREGIDLDFALDGDPVELTILDATPGVPPSGGSIVAARPLTAVQTQDGDVTILTRRERL